MIVNSTTLKGPYLVIIENNDGVNVVLTESDDLGGAVETAHQASGARTAVVKFVEVTVLDMPDKGKVPIKDMKEFRGRLSIRSARVLRNLGLETFGDLGMLTKKGLLEQKGCGAMTVREISMVCSELGITIPYDS